MLKHRVQHHNIQQQDGTGKYQQANAEQYDKFTTTTSRTDAGNITLIQDGDDLDSSKQILVPQGLSQSGGRHFAGINHSPSRMAQNDICRSHSPSRMNCEEPRERTASDLRTNDTLRVPTKDAEDAVRKITKKYDSIGNLSSCSQKSPSSDGGSFSFTDMVMSQKFREGVSEKDLLQVDTFYRSHKTEVHVCGCLANLYFGSLKSALNNDQWTFSCTGIPLLLLDTGEHHRERKLYIIVAEKGTGFTLWRDVINNQTSYRTPNSNFHTMHTSKDHTQLAGFSFDDAKAAAEFYDHVHRLTSDPNDELLKPGNIKKKKSFKDNKKKVKLPKKTEISNPCCFVHVTKLEKPLMQENDDDTENESSNPNEISAPFNFVHVTGPKGLGSDLNSMSNLMGSKLTLTSTSSIDSGLSEDRSSSKTGN